MLRRVGRSQLLRAGRTICSSATSPIRAASTSSAAASGSSTTASTSDEAPTSFASTEVISSSAVQLSVLMGSGVLLQLGAGMIVPCLPAYAASLDLPASSVGLIVAVPAFARACLNLPAGRLADVIGRKRPMIVGSVLDGLGCIGTAMAGGLPSMVGSRLVMGAGSSIAGDTTQAHVVN